MSVRIQVLTQALSDSCPFTELIDFFFVLIISQFFVITYISERWAIRKQNKGKLLKLTNNAIICSYSHLICIINKNQTHKLSASVAFSPLEEIKSHNPSLIPQVSLNLYLFY